MKEQLRISSIKIESPIKVKEVWVHVTIEKVIWDDAKENILEIIPSYGFISKSAPSFALDSYKITDPITAKELDISGAGIGVGITHITVNWLLNKYNAEVDSKGDVWL